MKIIQNQNFDKIEQIVKKTSQIIYIMKKTLSILIILFLFFSGQAQEMERTDLSKKHHSSKSISNSINELNSNGDLNLPNWGPYSKKYAGVSHIPEFESGIRFDLSVFPAIYKGKVTAPNVWMISDYHPWESSPNLEYYSYRHDLEWKDKIYGDVSYSKIDDNSRLVRVECVNNTELPQAMAVHFIAYMQFPPLRPYAPDNYLKPAEVVLPKNAFWVDALDYTEMDYAKPNYKNNLVTDGKLRGEVRSNGFVKGSAVKIGENIGDYIVYTIPENDINRPSYIFRYKLKKGEEAKITCAGTISKTIIFKGTGAFETIAIPADIKGSKLRLTSQNNIIIDIDGFVIAESSQENKVSFSPVKWNFKPEYHEGPVENSKILKYENTNQYYGILWFFKQHQFRQFHGRDLDFPLRLSVKENNASQFYYDGEGHYTNIYLRPIEMEANSKRIIYGVVCTGTKQEVETKLKEMSKSSKSDFDDIYTKNKAYVYDIQPNKSGEKYQFSQQLMASTLMNNTMYPVYTKGSYIRHMSPGKRWDVVYTWDAGFIGLGLLDLDVKSAIENLNTYLNEPGSQSAFLHHGSPVPVQLYLFKELWNKTQDKEILAYFYPRVKQYHEFLAGRLGSSNTRNMKSGLLRTWDYFYNSGGWDDYPPQDYVSHHSKLNKNVSPVINTAHAIRTAKILLQAAKELGINSDIKAYEEDIKIFTEALQKYSWDEETGYFSYVVHDENGIPKGIFKTETGENFNKGLDGCYPLVSGICTDIQQKTIINHLKSENEIWTKVGLSAVDQSASYYKNDGYWNGAVWMPHQWFFWKALLDKGDAEFAHKIAKTALDAWKTEVEATYNTTEHFNIKTGRGNGWHQFGALSSPVINWYTAYFTPGTITVGLDAWIESKIFNTDNSELETNISFIKKEKGKISSIVLCMNANYKYDVFLNGKTIKYTELYPGTLSINIPRNKMSCMIEIRKVKS